MPPLSSAVQTYEWQKGCLNSDLGLAGRADQRSRAALLGEAKRGAVPTGDRLDQAQPQFSAFDIVPPAIETLRHEQTLSDGRDRINEHNPAILGARAVEFAGVLDKSRQTDRGEAATLAARAPVDPGDPVSNVQRG